MKIAISNTAWEPNEDGDVAALLSEMGIHGIEIAPTKLWPFPLSVSDSEIKSYRRFWEGKGIQIVAMQSLLFGRPDLTIFGEKGRRDETFDHLCGMIRLGGRLGAGVLVFGSPKNRRVDNLDPKTIEEIAVPFFYNLGETAVKDGITFCIEPNPTVYGCDFITSSGQGLDLVSKVNSKGFGLHLDSGATTLTKEPLDASFEHALRSARHFHVSEPNLAPIGTGSVDHVCFASALRRTGYKNFVSIEMRSSGDSVNRIKAALQYVLSIFS